MDYLEDLAEDDVEKEEEEEEEDIEEILKVLESIVSLNAQIQVEPFLPLAQPWRHFDFLHLLNVSSHNLSSIIVIFSFVCN